MIKAIRDAMGVNPKVVSLLEMGFPLANDQDGLGSIWALRELAQVDFPK